MTTENTNAPLPSVDGQQPAAPVPAVDLVKAAEQEFLSSGKLSEATYEAIAKTHNLTREHVDLVIEGRKAKAEAQAAAIKQDVLSVIGGDEQRYTEMAKWAKQAYSPEEIELFDKTLASGDPVAIKQQLKVLDTLYKSSNKQPIGFSARQMSAISGAAAAAGDPGRFRNMQDMRVAMKDSRYLSDPNYTRDLQAKAAKGFIER